PAPQPVRSSTRQRSPPCGPAPRAPRAPPCSPSPAPPRWRVAARSTTRTPRPCPPTSQAPWPCPRGGAAPPACRRGAVGELPHPRVGQLSGSSQSPCGVSPVVSGSALALPGLLQTVVERRPTSQTANSRTWGPWTPGGLDPLTYRAVVEKTGPLDFDFAIEAR